MKALVLRADSFGTEEISTPVPSRDQVLIKVHTAALNRRDQWIREGKYAKIQLPAVLGSDGFGTVVQVGDASQNHWLHQKVVINPNINWGNNPQFQSKEFHILGMPTFGTLAEYLVVGVDRIHPVPEHLDENEAAALPLGGLTAYNALFNKGQLTAGKKVLISGVGGGVAQFAFQFAVAAGARTWVTSSKKDVIEQCESMGAEGGVNYKEPDAIKSLAKSIGGFDIIIDSAGGDGMNTLLMALASGGKLVFYGATQGAPSQIPVHAMFWNHWSMIGSTMGSDEDFIKMLEFVKERKLKPVVDKVFALDDAPMAFERIKEGLQFGKIVVKVS